jgi:hypothetical protein
MKLLRFQKTTIAFGHLLNTLSLGTHDDEAFSPFLVRAQMRAAAAAAGMARCCCRKEENEVRT